VDQVLLGLGIEPVLAELGYLEKRQNEDEGDGGSRRQGRTHLGSTGPSEGVAARAGAVEGRRGDGIEDDCGAAAEASRKVKQMLHLAHA